MASLQLSLKVIMPLCLWMAIGYFMRLKIKLDEHWLQMSNKIIFHVLLPMMLFRNMFEGDISKELGDGSVGT